MGKKISRVLILLAAVAASLVSSISKANDVFDEFQITCNKELKYFALRTLALEDTNVMYSADKVKSEMKNGFYPPGAIAHHPYSCDLGDKSISIEVIDGSSLDGKGECGAMGKYSVTIQQDGSDIYKFNPYGLNRCLNPETHLIELSSPYTLRDCVVPDASGQTTCSYPTKN